MKTIGCMVFMLLMLISGNSCVSRTTTRSPKIGEVGRPGEGNDRRSKETKIIWIWEKEFRRKNDA